MMTGYILVFTSLWLAAGFVATSYLERVPGWPTPPNRGADWIVSIVIWPLMLAASKPALISMRRRESVERRSHYRYQLGAPVMFFWKDAQDTQHEDIGITHDISLKGLFVFTTSPPPLESDVKLKAFLSLGRSPFPPLRIQGQGRVVRVDAAHGGLRRAGFAAAGEPFVLRRGEEYR